MGKQPLPNEVVNILNLVNAHLLWQNKNGPPRGYEIYHPSAFGGCLRKMQYQRYEERGLISAKTSDPKPTMLRIWDTGHTMHSRWAKYFEDIGVLRGKWQCSNPLCGKMYGNEVDIGIFKPITCCSCGSNKFDYHEVTVKSEELNFRGHIDQILDFRDFDASKYKMGNAVPILFKEDELPKNPIVVDMKTINGMSFKSKLENGPPFGYKVQVTIYIHLLNLEYGLLIFENKDNSEVKIEKINRNEKWWNQIKQQAKQMNEMVEEGKLPPPRPESMNSYDCRYCDYKSICHGSKGQSTIWDRKDLADLRKQFYGDLLE